MSPLLADFIHARGYKPICAKLLTLPGGKARKARLGALAGACGAGLPGVGHKKAFAGERWEDMVR